MTPAAKLAERLRKSPPILAQEDGLLTCHMAEVRKQLGLTQADVAQAVGISLTYICYLELGRRWPALPLAARLARFYGKKIEELWELPPEVQ